MQPPEEKSHAADFARMVASTDEGLAGQVEVRMGLLQFDSGFPIGQRNPELRKEAVVIRRAARSSVAT
jgi:hypothetical protein